MNKPYEMIVKGRPLGEIIAAISNCDEREMSEQSTTLKDAELVLIADWSSKVHRKRCVDSTLITGSILLAFSIATATESRKEMFDLLLTDMGMSKSQAYRCINVARCFGSTLLGDEKLRQAFVVESLKLLAEPGSSEDARKRAIELARNGERITIKKAKSLISSNTGAKETNCAVESKSARKRGPSVATKLKKLVERLTTEFQRPQKPLPNQDIDYLIVRLEGILEKLRAQQGFSDSSSEPVSRETLGV